ncbi:hypothetical protein FGO68_gene3731 [Halteria grandinella]|uniref:Uncharacterized protein n=1 Tax=Halteria grandinella TaxID=5974 RepID=A0A8J8NGS1_HALGN|nr:hypothetical protein FGO68_gene3731 [Halteria grandinella]
MCSLLGAARRSGGSGGASGFHLKETSRQGGACNWVFDDDRSQRQSARSQAVVVRSYSQQQMQNLRLNRLLLYQSHQQKQQQYYQIYISLPLSKFKFELNHF